MKVLHGLTIQIQTDVTISQYTDITRKRNKHMQAPPTYTCMCAQSSRVMIRIAYVFMYGFSIVYSFTHFVFRQEIYLGLHDYRYLHSKQTFFRRPFHLNHYVRMHITFLWYHFYSDITLQSDESQILQQFDLFGPPQQLL